MLTCFIQSLSVTGATN